MSIFPYLSVYIFIGCCCWWERIGSCCCVGETSEEESSRVWIRNCSSKKKIRSFLRFAFSFSHNYSYIFRPHSWLFHVYKALCRPISSRAKLKCLLLVLTIVRFERWTKKKSIDIWLKSQSVIKKKSNKWIFWCNWFRFKKEKKRKEREMLKSTELLLHFSRQNKNNHCT